LKVECCLLLESGGKWAAPQSASQNASQSSINSEPLSSILHLQMPSLDTQSNASSAVDDKENMVVLETIPPFFFEGRIGRKTNKPSQSSDSDEAAVIEAIPHFIFEGRMAKNHEKAFNWNKDSADKGLLSIEGMQSLAFCYSQGLGCEQNNKLALYYTMLASSV
jgi:TPR repeat protein